jgi:serine/threonine protein kinase/tetratricopeptide (TPR) repeat protein
VSSGAALEPCPDEAIIAGFAQGELPPEQAAALEVHLDACEACGLVVAELARIFAADPPPAALVSADPRSEPGLHTQPGPRSDAGPLRSGELVETLVAEDADPGPRPLGALLPAGAEVGRYRVLDCIGVGGMGVVYAAYDPVLDRRVALKLLRGTKGSRGSEGRNARLLREAQALAKLTHPNVITVHDVGTWEAQVFVAMEHVEGLTLKQWLRTRRSWPELREVFVAAGRGLAAAHAADLVHRDFKPDNVLIGRDGRVRVTDFGLARWGQAAPGGASSSSLSVPKALGPRKGPTSERPPEKPSGPEVELRATDELRLSSSGQRGSGMQPAEPSPVVSLTETGSLVGTPAYMAPEQYEHRTADAPADQFAFCVALYEAIHGGRPFAGRTVAELASNVLEGRMAEAQHEVEVPRAVRQALRRGLSRRPGDRFASMDELLAVLDHRPARRLRPWALVGVPLVAVGAAGLWAYAQGDIMRSAFCRTERGLSEVWEPERREAIAGAFLATGLPYAADTVERALPAVDEYVAGWERLRARSCEPEATILEGPGGAALRERCLDRRRVALEALLEGFEQATPETVARAVGSVAALPEVERCGDPEALVAELPPAVPPELREAVDAVRDELARGEGLLAGGRYAEALELSRRADAESQALGHRPLQAETRYLLGRLLDLVGNAEAAAAALEEAGLFAAASRHRRVLARVLVDQVYVLGVSMPHMAEADKLARRAHAELEGAGMEAEGGAALLLNQGSVAYRRGDYYAAAELFRRALARRDREREPLRWADAAFNLATIELMMGREREAITELEGYIEVFEEALGSMHPEVASGWHNLGTAYLNAGQSAQARAALERAEAIRRQTLGVDHPLYAATLNTLGSAFAAEGKPEEGLRYCERSVEILTANGTDPIETASNRVDVAELLAELGHLPEAEREVMAALEILRAGLGPDHPHVGAAHGVLAKIAAARGEAAAVRRHVDRAYAIATLTLGEGHPGLDDALVERATLLARAGEREEAITGLRALVERPLEGPPSSGVHGARLQLAELLWAEPEHRAEARALAERAARELRSQRLEPEAVAAEQWLREHPDEETVTGPARDGR